MEDLLVKAMSNEDLEALKVKYAGNQSMTTLIDGILEVRHKEEAQAKLVKDFEAKVSKLAKLPQPPEGIHNIYLVWREVEEPQGEPELLAEDVCKANGLEVGTIRQATIKVWKWVVETNKGFQPVKATNKDDGGEASATKRGITVYKRTGTTLEAKGNYRSASKACETFKLPLGGDSAMRVLARNGYITEPYLGSDFTG